MRKILLPLMALMFILGFYIQAQAELNEVDKQELKFRNIVKNSGFENGKQFWTNSGGTWLTFTSATHLGEGLVSTSFDASSSGQYIQSNLATIPQVLRGKDCMSRVFWKGGDGNLVFEVLDGSGNSMGYRTLSVASDYEMVLPIYFTCPMSGSLRVKIRSTADAAIAYFDKFYIGEASSPQKVTNPQSLVASGYFDSAGLACLWSLTSTSFTDFTADSDCTGPVVEFNPGPGVLQTTDADLPQFTINSLPKGYYKVTWNVMANAGANTNNSWRISDGTNASGGATTYKTSEVDTVTLIGFFKYDTSGNRTFKIQGRGQSSLTYIDFQYDDTRMYFSVERMPTEEENTVTNNYQWFVDASIGGGNPALSSTSTRTELTDNGLDIVRNQGSVEVKIPCDTTNPPTGLTCAAGAESVGVHFTPKTTGLNRACFAFGAGTVAGTNQSNYATFEIVETPSNAQTILQQGKDRQLTGIIHGPAGNNVTMYYPYQVCGTFNFENLEPKTLRLMYESSLVTGWTVIADRDANYADRDIHVTVFPVAPSIQPPVMIANKPVFSSSSGNFQTGGGPTDVTNLSVTIDNSSKNPIEIFLQDDGSSSGCEVRTKQSGASVVHTSNVYILRNGSSISNLRMGGVDGSANGETNVPCTAIRHIDDDPPIGSVEYKIQLQHTNNGGGGFSEVNYSKLGVRRLP